MTKLIVTFRNFPKAPNKLNPAAAVIIIIIIPPKILANTSLTVTKLLTFPDPCKVSDETHKTYPFQVTAWRGFLWSNK